MNISGYSVGWECGRCWNDVVTQDVAVLHANESVGMRLQARIVRDDNDGRAALLRCFVQQADHDLAVLGVERGSRLVGKDQLTVIFASARAMATRCFSPPESSAGRCFRRSPNPTACKAASARRRASSLPDPQVFEHLHDSCCSASSAGNRLKPWKMKPQWSRRNWSICRGFFPRDFRPVQ